MFVVASAMQYRRLVRLLILTKVSTRLMIVLYAIKLGVKDIYGQVKVKVLRFMRTEEMLLNEAQP